MKIWKWFWVFMAVGFAARTTVALTCDCHSYADEFMNYLEQAHRAVFGYGFIPWEYRFGVRTWLIPAIPALPMWIAKTAGLDSPSFYVPFVYSFNALISMAIPAGMYFFTRRAVSENAARYALVFGSLWYELIVFAPRTLAETYATAAFFGAMALLSQKQGRKIFFAGLLLGLTISLRWQYAVPAAVLGLVWLISFEKNRNRLIAVSGGISAILIWGLVDFLTWGDFLHSAVNYVRISAAFPSGHFRVSDISSLLWYADIVRLAAASFGLHIIFLLIGAVKWKRVFIPMLLILLTLAIHTSPQAGEYRMVFVAIPLLWIIASSVLSSADGKIKLFCFFAILSVSVAGFAGKLPKMNLALGDYTNYLNASTTQGINAAKILGKSAVGEDVRGVLWLAGNQIFSGGYFYLHRNIPSYFTADPQNLQLVTNALNSGRKLNTIASHIVAPDRQRRFEGFEVWDETADLNGLIIYRNLTPQSVTPVSGLFYDTFDPNWIGIGDRAKKLGIKINPLPLTPYKPTKD